MKLVFISLLTAVAGALYFGLSFLHLFILALEIFFILYFLARIGRKFVFLELLALVAVTQWLFGPMLAEHYDIKIEVPYSRYFAYAIPGTLLYLAGLTLPLWHQRKLDQRIIVIFDRISDYYGNRHSWGIALILLGLPFWIYQNNVPVSLNFIFFLLSHLLMVGICLLMFTNYRLKWIWVGLGLFLLVTSTLLNGMIGSVIIWVFIIWMIYSTRKPVRISYAVKIISFLIFVWVLIVMQSAKTEYRKLTWLMKRNEMTGYVNREIKQDPALFYNLIKEKMFDTKIFSDQSSMIGLASRMNQGYLVSLAMDYVPRKRDFGRGNVTFYSSGIAFIPRIFWPDKPVVGQAEYFKKYTGVQLTKYTSATLGPIGDAYADFGSFGILFLGIFGLGIGGLFSFWISKSLHHPGFFLWFIVLYLGSIAVTEVSIAGYVNGVFKYVIFIFVMRFLLRTAGIKV